MMTRFIYLKMKNLVSQFRHNPHLFAQQKYLYKLSTNANKVVESQESQDVLRQEEYSDLQKTYNEELKNFADNVADSNEMLDINTEVSDKGITVDNVLYSWPKGFAYDPSHEYKARPSYGNGRVYEIDLIDVTTGEKVVFEVVDRSLTIEGQPSLGEDVIVVDKDLEVGKPERTPETVDKRHPLIRKLSRLIDGASFYKENGDFIPVNNAIKTMKDISVAKANVQNLKENTEDKDLIAEIETYLEEVDPKYERLNDEFQTGIESIIQNEFEVYVQAIDELSNIDDVNVNNFDDIKEAGLNGLHRASDLAEKASDVIWEQDKDFVSEYIQAAGNIILKDAYEQIEYAKLNRVNIKNPQESGFPIEAFRRIKEQMVRFEKHGLEYEGVTQEELQAEQVEFGKAIDKKIKARIITNDGVRAEFARKFRKYLPKKLIDQIEEGKEVTFEETDKSGE